ncbi:unnamed protein product [Rhizophagus irregularis]|nr:unnamed protein product [Rhizophagus irregularis]
MEKPSFVSTKLGSAVQVGFRSIETPKIHSAVWVGFRSMEKPSFVRVGFRVPKNGKIPRFDLVGFQRTKTQRFIGWASEERKPKDKIHSEERKPKDKDSTGWTSEERKPKDSIGWASEERKPKDKDSTGWASEERKPKDSIGWASEKRKPKDKDSCGGLLTNENPKIKICSGRCLPISEEWKKPRFWASEEQRKTKIRFGIFRKVEPRFVLTNLGLVSRVGSDKQKKTKDSFSGFPKDQDSRTLGEWQRTAAKKSAKVRPALDHKLA